MLEIQSPGEEVPDLEIRKKAHHGLHCSLLYKKTMLFYIYLATRLFFAFLCLFGLSLSLFRSLLTFRNLTKIIAKLSRVNQILKKSLSTRHAV